MLSRYFEKPFFRDIVFFLTLALVMGTVCWDSNISKGVTEPHLWRQSDCISLTEYYAKGVPFLEPEMHSRISDDGRSGKTVAEFPIIYYIIGKIWSVTGTQLWIFRLFNALFSLVALICLYRTLLRITGTWFWSAIGPLLLLSSPVYAYYGISFLPNIPAFNCIIIAWYFIFRYYHDQKTKQLVWASVFFTFAGLLKISSATSYLALLLILGLEIVRITKFKAEGKIFPKPLLASILLLIPLVVILLWYLGFVEHYCNEHFGRYSFTSPVPVWEASELMYSATWNRWFDFTLYQIYPAYIWIFFLGAMFFLLAQFRKINRVWIILMPCVFIGHAIFSLLFFFCLDGHDYYHIDLLAFFVITYAALAKYISTRETIKWRKNFMRITAVLTTTCMVLSCANNMQLRFHGCHPPSAYCKFFASESTIYLLNYFHDLDWLRQPYDQVAVELTKHGFSDTTVVIAANDVSFNSLLIKLHRPGFTAMADWQLDSSWTMWRIDRGAQVLVVENPENEMRGIKQFMDYPLFRVEHIAVFDLRPYKQ